MQDRRRLTQLEPNSVDDLESFTPDLSSPQCGHSIFAIVYSSVWSVHVVEDGNRRTD